MEDGIKIQGPGFLTLLGLVFITLKLCGVIAWSWWWVTLPLWGGLALLISILIAVCIVGGLFLAISALFAFVASCIKD